MTTWERDADHYFLIGREGLCLLRAIRGSTLRIYAVLLAKLRPVNEYPCGGSEYANSSTTGFPPGNHAIPFSGPGLYRL